jgi:hypothetical protein
MAHQLEDVDEEFYRKYVYRWRAVSFGAALNGFRYLLHSKIHNNLYSEATSGFAATFALI